MITLIFPTLASVFLVAIRLGTVLLFAPIQAIRLLPIHARLLIVIALSTLLTANLSLPAAPVNETALVAGALAEFANGLILSMSLYAAFAVFSIAGQMIDTQMGLNSLAILNPADHSHEPLTSRLLSMLALLFFFSLGGFQWLIQGLTYSFLMIPPGELILLKGLNSIIKQFSFMFSLGLIIASPVVIGLWIIDLCGGVLTRNMPQANPYFITLPVKILLGLFLFSLMLTYISPLMGQVFDHGFQSWLEILP
ncbi:MULTISPECIES: flagellar biosynthetic protein FliR [unclassified Legionella]|uniref:flagellar biosynthetic protein FliR n=1 Tax=unclassified Legionella TaxID=2622702 RepID=UPI001056DAB6|nr:MULTISPECIES: flagellar biosynthetic protein FliR [unclassified Legionella]MDI9817567.1 flagellar biosynthetic protein FliR [Legionella sp. PL877]